MKVAFLLCGSRKAYEHRLAEALSDGCPDKFRILKDGYQGGYDLYCVMGVKNARMIRRLQAKGHRFLYFDKAYNRDWPEWWRVAIDAHQPTAYLGLMDCPPDRARVQGWASKPWREEGGHIVLAGSSAKYHKLYGLDDPNEYAHAIIRTLQKVTGRAVYYRPKPSWGGAADIDGAKLINRARHPITDDLRGAHALITHGSNACLEAMLEGVPSIVLGNAVARPISSTTLADIEAPRLADDDERGQLFNNLAYCQWSLEEMRRGPFWEFLMNACTSTTRANTSISTKAVKNGFPAR